MTQETIIVDRLSKTYQVPEREGGFGVLERHRCARPILGVDPAALFPDRHGFVHAADRLQFNAAASAHAAGPVADGSRRPEAIPVAREIREVGEQGPYRARGGGHATLNRDVAFRHEDRSGLSGTL